MADRILTGLAIFGALVLAGAAVWMGGLNQDEGWYLYAANLVAEGQIPYADFAFTQGPVMPIVYSAFAGIWKSWGLLGARVFTLSLGFAGILFAALTARRMAGARAALVVFLLLGCNLYHLYYLAIPKTYALAALFVSIGFYLLTFVRDVRQGVRVTCAVLSGASFALAAGTRISLGVILPVVGLWLLVDSAPSPRQDVGAPTRVTRRSFPWFVLGVVVVLAVIYGGLLLFPATRDGLLAAQKYHAARGGFDLVFAVGSLSRLVRWYLPVFIVLGLGLSRGLRFVRGTGVVLVAFLAVFAVQMLAPFPYEDYQVPIMSLLAFFAAVNLVGAFGREDRSIRSSTSTRDFDFPVLLLALGLAFASSFGSPLLEKWMTNGQDRFWSLKKEKCELAQLRDVAKKVEAIDPGGETIFTQDLYLAIETNRKVPRGLEMGPFSILSDAEWRALIASAPCAVAAVSGYTFAVNPPKCDERPIDQQLDYLSLLKTSYSAVDRISDFGQNATTLLLLRRNGK